MKPCNGSYNNNMSGQTTRAFSNGHDRKKILKCPKVMRDIHMGPRITTTEPPSLPNAVDNHKP